MSSRYLQEVQSGLNSPFWAYVKKTLEDQVKELRKEGSTYRIEALTDFANREQMFMKANALEQFVEELPHKIRDEYKQKLTEETKDSNE